MSRCFFEKLAFPIPLHQKNYSISNNPKKFKNEKDFYFQEECNHGCYRHVQLRSRRMGSCFLFFAEHFPLRPLSDSFKAPFLQLSENRSAVRYVFCFFLKNPLQPQKNAIPLHCRKEKKTIKVKIIITKKRRKKQ